MWTLLWAVRRVSLWFDCISRLSETIQKHKIFSRLPFIFFCDKRKKRVVTCELPCNTDDIMWIIVTIRRSRCRMSHLHQGQFPIFLFKSKASVCQLVCVDVFAVMKKANLDCFCCFKDAQWSTVARQIRLAEVNVLGLSAGAQQAALTRLHSDGDSYVGMFCDVQANWEADTQHGLRNSW